MRQSQLPTAFCSRSPRKEPPLLRQEGVPTVSQTTLAEREDEDRSGLPQESTGKPPMLDGTKPGLLSEIPGEEPSVRHTQSSPAKVP